MNKLRITSIKNGLRSARFALRGIRFIPHILIYKTNFLHSNRKIIEADVARWIEIKNNSTATNEQLSQNTVKGLIYFLTFNQPLRNVFYHRIGVSQKLISFLCPSLKTLNIHTEFMGLGLYVNHGSAVEIAGGTVIGKYAYLHQIVTIGWGKKGVPNIGDNLFVASNATITGFMTIGNNATIKKSAGIGGDDIIIGDNFVMGVAATIAGDSVIIGDNVIMKSKSSIAKNAHIGDNVIIGFGATICPNVKIGKNSIIGSGAIVIDNIPENSLVKCEKNYIVTDKPC